MRKVQRQNHLELILLFLCWLFFGIQSVFSSDKQSAFILVMAILFFIISFFSSILIFSCFIIPVEEPFDILIIFTRIIRFHLGLHGPIHQIRYGRMETRYAGINSNQPGIVLLDSASAAIVSQTTSYHRTIGPGVCFLQKNEKISHTADLSVQRIWIGPLEKENPFLLRFKGESNEEYLSRLKRADETTAYTADEKKIIASFLVFFKIKANPGEGGSPFGYNPLSVNKALIEGAISLSGKTQINSTIWSDLPGFLVSDIWKNEISKYFLKDLFSTRNAKLIDCVNKIQNELVEESVTKLKEVNSNSKSQFINLLRDRGLVIKNVYLMKIFLDHESINEKTSMKK